MFDIRTWAYFSLQKIRAREHLSMNISNILFIIGTAPFLILGSLHLIYTLKDNSQPKRLAPRSATLVDEMKNTPLKLTKETDMWRAWIGFNASHSIGVLSFSSIYLYLSLYDFAFLNTSGLIWGALLLAAAYALLARLYWFRIPFIGSLIGLGFFTASILT